MADSTWCKLVFKSQTALGGFQCIFFTALQSAILVTLQVYHASDRLNFSCDPKPSDFNRNTCYNNYIDMISKPHGLIPLNVVALTLSVLCASWICFAIFGAVLLRKIKSSRDNVKTRKTFRCIYFIHVFFRIFFLGGMLGLSCSYPTIDLPSTYKCEVHQTPQNNNQTIQSSIHPTKMTLHCKDLHYKQKSMLNRVIIAVDALYMMCGILEVLYMWCTEGPVEQKLLGDLENVELGPLLETITAYTTALKTSITDQTEFQPKLLASHTISNAKTDEIFTNLLIQHGRKGLTRNDGTYSRSEDLEYFGKVSGTAVKHCDEIFLGTSNDQENPNSILVVGKAGIGKSLFCQKLIRDWANNNLFQARENIQIPNFKFAYLLTFRQLNLLDEEPVTLREILNSSSFLEDNSIIDDVTFEYIVKHPREVLIILDGYDEYSQQDYIAEDSGKKYQNNARCEMPVAALCSKLIKGEILKGSVVVVTSRPDESNKLGGIRFERYVEIVGFSSQQVKEYIEKYFKKNKNMKSAVLEHVMKNENLVSFAHIPMLCYLLCFEMEYTLNETRNPRDLPVSTTDIYTKLIDIFELKHCSESEYRQKEIPDNFNVVLMTPPVIKTTLEKLSKLAAKLLLERKPTFDESEIEGGFELEEVNKLKGSGLLHCGQPFRTGSITTTKHFSFTHLTVQEFLAAHWFVKENCIPVEKCSEMVFQFMAGILSSEGKEELMEKLLTSIQVSGNVYRFLLRVKCLSEYQDKEFAKTFIRKHRQAFSSSDGVMYFEGLSDIDSIALSFVLDIISELNKEKAGEAQHKCSDKFVPVKDLRLFHSRLTMSGIQRVCNSLINEHSLVSELFIGGSVDISMNTFTKITDTDVASLCEALKDPSCKLTTLDLTKNEITDTGVTSLCEALKNPSCKLTTLNLYDNEITDTGVTSLCKAFRHSSCQLTTLDLSDNEITDTGVASLLKALRHPSCKLTTLNLLGNKITDTGVASLCKALQHPSCKLTTLNLRSNEITSTGVANLCEALQNPSCTLTRLNIQSNYSLSELTKEYVQAIVEKYRPGFELTI